MLPSAALLLAMAQTPSYMQRGPHPAFMYSPALAETVFQNGLADGRQIKDIDSIWQPLTQGIGTIHQGPFSQTVSWMWAFPWQASVYEQGVRAHKDSWASDHIATYLNGIKSSDQSNYQIAFRADIKLQPSFDDNGAIDRYPDPSEFANVTAFLKVGDRLYPPIEQPGNVFATTREDTTDVTIPETTTTTTEKTVVDRTEKKRKKKTVTTTTTTERHETVEYTWYESCFDVWFDLKNPDGTYRVTPADKLIEVVITYGGNERHAKFKLDDFMYSTRKTRDLAKKA